MLRSKEDAEDMLQQSFLKAYDKYHSFDEAKASIYTWLYRITYNNCLDRIAKKKELYGNDYALETFKDSTISQEEAYIVQQTSAKLDDKIKKLPDSQRNALNLFYFEELKIKEAANVMDISPKAFESLLIRARKSLKNIMKYEISNV